MRRALVITVSDRATTGERPDTNGPLLASLLADLGLHVGPVVVVPDELEAIRGALTAAVTQAYDLVLTTGGHRPDAARRHPRGHPAPARA